MSGWSEVGRGSMGLDGIAVDLKGKVRRVLAGMAHLDGECCKIVGVVRVDEEGTVVLPRFEEEGIVA